MCLFKDTTEREQRFIDGDLIVCWRKAEHHTIYYRKQAYN